MNASPTQPDSSTHRDAAPGGRRRRWRTWLLAAVAAVVVSALLRLFIAEAFRIPTASMEPTLAAGDFVLVSKFHYGPRLPRAVRLPLTGWRVPGIRLPQGRLPGARDVHRGDVIVFYHPAEGGEIELRTPYVKRAVGLPGDTVEVRAKQLYVNGRPADLAEHLLLEWLVEWDERAEPQQVREHGATPVERAGLRVWRVRATEEQASGLRRLADVASVRPAPGRPDGALFPPGTQYTPDDYGPVVVPARGQRLEVDDQNWPVVRAMLEREGRHAQRLAAGRYEMDGAVANSVTFERDYYFVMGDNRDDSADSRRWGFVPDDHVIGKAAVVYFSWDGERRRPRLGRTLAPVR